MPATDQDAPLAPLRDAFAQSGLFAGKPWRFSPRPFPLSAALYQSLQGLGEHLWLFQRACNDLYALSAAGRQPAWVAALLDQGKPPELVAFARQKSFRHHLPRVLRPNLILTEDGFVLSKLDSAPNAIGLTAWLNQTYAALGFEVVGGPLSMLEGFAQLAPQGDILVSGEAETNRPEVEWLAHRTGQRVCAAEGYGTRPDRRAAAYRFFELIDLPNIPGIAELQAAVLDGSQTVTPPFKPQLEEKLWFALFWMRPLRDFWRRTLGDRHYTALQKVIPRTWVLTPEVLPPQAEIPGLGIHKFDEIADLSHKARELVIKSSGFSQRPRSTCGVVDLDQPPTWKDALDTALKAFPSSPHVLQHFHEPAILQHPVFDEASSAILPFPCTVRLCPYYFVNGDKPALSGALATLSPPDQSNLQGMRDSLFLPAGMPLGSA